MKYQIFLNGELQHGVLEANSAQGKLIRFKTTSPWPCRKICRDPTNAWGYETEELTGDVKIWSVEKNKHLHSFSSHYSFSYPYDHGEIPAGWSG